MANITELIDAQIDAYLDRDLDRFLSFYADDVTIRDFAGNKLMDLVQMRERYGRLFHESPELAGTIASRLVLDEFVVDDERLTGYLGQAGEVRVVVIYHVVDGQIAEVMFLR